MKEINSKILVKVAIIRNNWFNIISKHLLFKDAVITLYDSPVTNIVIELEIL